MAFCIMRTQKLHNAGAVGSVLDHHLRLRETPNAEVTEITENWYDKVDYKDPLDRQENNDREEREKAKARAMEQFKAELPDKVRKNAVQAVELVMTASPESMQDPNFDKVQYLNDCDQWAKDVFGKDNVFFTAHHFDETTPHTSILLLPKDERGKLNCREFLGGRKKMRELQDSFYEQVGKKYNLDRGIKGSKAKHQEVKKFYGAVQQTKQEAYDISAQIAQSLPKKAILEWNSDYTEKVKAQIAHDLTPIVAKHLNAPSEKQRTRELNRTLAKTLERTTEETRQAVTQEVTQKLTDNYSADLEQAVQERTREQADAVARAQRELRDLQRANLLREQKEKEEKARKAREEKERKAKEEKAKQEQEERERKEQEQKARAEKAKNDEYIRLKEREAFFCYDTSPEWYIKTGREMQQKGCKNYQTLLIHRAVEKRDQERAEAERKEILENGFGSVGWELTERGTIELFTREMFGKNRATEPFFEIKEKEWIDALTAGKNVQVREKYYVNSLKKDDSGRVRAIGCFPEESKVPHL